MFLHPKIKNIKSPVDITTVNLNEAWEVAYWAREFHCNAVALQNAVKVVGNSADRVREFFSKIS
jgi:hypothetical protein